jgi:hypothetical protein
MRKVKLLGLAALSLFAFAAFTATAAFGEEADKNSPQLLVLTGKVSELKGTLTAKAGSDIKLVSLSLKNDLTASTAEIKLENCTAESTSELDTTLCPKVPFKFTNVKKGEVNCSGEKEEIGVVQGSLSVHFAAEESLKGAETMQLEPLILGKVLSTTGTEPLKFACGLVKVQVKGVVVCLALGLKNISTEENVTITCAVTSGSDLETGHCEVLCKVFGETVVLEASFNGGTTFEDIAWLLTVEGPPSKDIFIDD